MSCSVLPFDLLQPILSHLSHIRDLHSSALVSVSFNRAATPLLYNTLDSRLLSKSPYTTLLKRPHLAKYVRHVIETAALHRGLLPRYTTHSLSALALCTNLTSMTWIDDVSNPHSILLSFLVVLRTLPLRELTIRTHSDLSQAVWDHLTHITGLTKFSIWCMEGPPRVLHDWSSLLGNTLTHLELGVTTFSLSCSVLLSHLPLLKVLRLKGAPASSIPAILASLPNLSTLDTEYPSGSSILASPSSPSSPFLSPSFTTSPLSLPTLRNLTIRTSSMVTPVPQKLWDWIRDLIPNPGLQYFRLHAFTVTISQTIIPRIFILDLARVHGPSLKHFLVGEAHLTLSDIESLCSIFPNLESLVCSVASPDVESIAAAIKCARNLRLLKLQVHWIETQEAGWVNRPRHPDIVDIGTRPPTKFTLKDASDMMLSAEHPQLRVIGIGPFLYTGRWVLQPQEECGDGQRDRKVERMLKFEIVADLAGDKWHT